MKNLKIIAEKDLIPLKLIRISKNMKVKEIAELMKVTPAYINAIEKGERKAQDGLIELVMLKLGSNLEEYMELQDFIKNIKDANISEDDKYSLSLIKAIGVATPELKEESEKILEKRLKYVVE